MKRICLAMIGGLAVATMGLLTGCEWSSGGDNDFNLSQGAGTEINFSGVYRGNLAGGKAVRNTSGSPITQIVIQQVGNSLEVYDNNGSSYKGSCGSPGVAGTPTAGVYPTGAKLAQAQVWWGGQDYSANGIEVEFAGVIHAVSVTDIKGNSTENTQSSSSSTEASDVGKVISSETFTNSTNRTVVEVVVTPVGTETTTIVYNRETGQEISRTTSVTKNNSSSKDSTATQYSVYEITEANTQYRLQGNWIEKGGALATVDALSPATAGIISAPTPSANAGGGSSGGTDSTATSSSSAGNSAI